jgi:hypothetical protein
MARNINRTRRTLKATANQPAPVAPVVKPITGFTCKAYKTDGKNVVGYDVPVDAGGQVFLNDFISDDLHSIQFTPVRG